MATINLYPWRLQNTKVNNRQFYLLFFGGNLLGVAIFVIFISFMQNCNIKLETSIQELMGEKNDLLTKVNNLRGQNVNANQDADTIEVELAQNNSVQDDMQEKYNFIKNNMKKRFKAAQILLQLAKSNNGSISLTKIKNDSQYLKLVGATVSTLAVAKFIDNIEHGLADLVLQTVEFNLDKKDKKSAMQNKLIVFTMVFMHKHR